MSIPIVKIEISASIVAWYGAIVATLSVIVSLIYLYYLIWKDKRKIKVKISEKIIVPDYGDKVYFFIEAINIGDKTVCLTKVGFSSDDKKQLIIFPKPNTWKLPFDLESGKNFAAWIDKKSIEDDLKKTKRKIEYVWFCDATGKIFKTKFNFQIK